MTKADLAEKIYERLSCTKQEAFDLGELTLETLKEAIAKEGHVKISGFGNFTVKQKAARKGRNPQTGEEITITPRRIVSINKYLSRIIELTGSYSTHNFINYLSLNIIFIASGRNSAFLDPPRNLCDIFELFNEFVYVQDGNKRQSIECQVRRILRLLGFESY
jgi:integration host factor subunit alpha